VTEIRFEIWGCRGGRNTYGSGIGNLTSCYSLRAGTDLFVFDAGGGLVALADAVLDAERMQGVSRVHLLVTHAHMDHWEGLKDAAWMWRPRNGLEVSVIAPAEAQEVIRIAHAPPSFVALEVLALGTVARLTFIELAAGATMQLPGATLRAVALHHYSGMSPDRRYLETLGYQLAIDGGPAVAYLSDHEPRAGRAERGGGKLGSSKLASIEANYGAITEHAFGHGSVEYAAALARGYPRTRVIGGHHGPLRSDDAILEAHRKHGDGCTNLVVAREGDALRWDPAAQTFTPV